MMMMMIAEGNRAPKNRT